MPGVAATAFRAIAIFVLAKALAGVAISTLRRPLESVDLETREPSKAAYERSDVCVVPAAGVIGEAMVAIVLAGAMIEKFGGDSLRETKRNYEGYLEQVRNF